METAETKKDAWESCGELVNGQPCGRESSGMVETPTGKTIFRCADHGGTMQLRIPSPVRYQKQSFSEELATGSRNWIRFLWQAGMALTALYLLVVFVRWVWIH
jgi:hypothetical protein